MKVNITSCVLLMKMYLKSEILLRTDANNVRNEISDFCSRAVNIV